MTSPRELDRFLADLGGRRERLLQLAGRPETDAAGLVAELNELAEQLIVADEELRVQQEELDDARRCAQSLSTERDLLFQTSAEAYVITDDRGVVLQTNRTADRLILQPPQQVTPRPIATWFEVADRSAVRTVITRMREGQASASLEDVVLRRFDGTTQPAAVNVIAVEDPAFGRRVLRWQLSARTTTLHAVPERLDAELTAAVSELSAAASLDDALRIAAQRAVQLVPGAGHATALIVHRQAVEAQYATDPTAAAARQAQSETAEGPALSAATQTGVIRLDEVGADGRWPRFARRAAELGIGSCLSVGVPLPQQRAAAVTCYADTSGAFDPAADAMASMFAAYAAAALGRIGAEATLREALRSRELIGQATGMIMQRDRVDARTAFEQLSRASQQSNTKVREIARRMTAAAGTPFSEAT